MKHSITEQLNKLIFLTLTIIFSMACQGGEEPLVLGSQVPETGGRNNDYDSEESGIEAEDINEGDMGNIEMMGGTPVLEGGQEVEVVCEELVDEERFAVDVGPPLINTCATFGCHSPNGPTSFDLPIQNTDFNGNSLEGELLTDTLAAVMSDPLYVVAGKPRMSLMLVKASSPHSGFTMPFESGSTEYQALASWIEDILQCTEVEVMGGEMMGGEMMGGMPVPGGNEGGNTQILCDLLPNGDPQNRANGQYYEVFENEINPILTNSCGSGGCHATSENGFWLQTSNESCSVSGNFLMTQAYINFANPNQSPILEAPYDPYHSGYAIFTGRTDVRFIAIQSWVLLGFED